MSLSKVLNYVTTAVAGGIGLAIRDHAKDAGLRTVEANVVSVTAMVASFAVLTVVTALPACVPAWRWMTRDEYGFEGDWIETVCKDGVMYYTLFSILYLWRSDSYVLSGIALDSKGSVHATWDSVHLHFEHKTNEVKLLYLARQKGKPHMPGYAEVAFVRQAGKPMDGKGFFVDMDFNPNRVEFEVERVDRILKQKLIGSCPRVMRSQDRKKFIVAYKNMQESA